MVVERGKYVRTRIGWNPSDLPPACQSARGHAWRPVSCLVDICQTCTRVRIWKEVPQPPPASLQVEQTRID